MKGLITALIASVSMSGTELKIPDGIRSVHTATTTSVQKTLDPENEGGGYTPDYWMLGLTALGTMVHLSIRNRK